MDEPGMQQDAEQDQVSGMTASVNPTNRVALLQEVKEFEQASLASIQRLADAAKLVQLRQGQTLLRAGSLETHAFVVIEGAYGFWLKSHFTAISSAWGELKLGNWWEWWGCCGNQPAKGPLHVAQHN